VDLLAAALLGVVQGLTEFLPVSSSGHLILARAFFGWDAGRFGLAFDVACHVGTVAAVALYFRHDILAMVRALPRAVVGPAGKAERLIWLVVVGTIPIVIVAGLFGDWFEEIRAPAVVAIALTVGGIGLIAAERIGSKRRDEDSIRPGHALAIGCAQAAALVPGISRSGATITVAMLFGLRRDAAARFVFLMSLPAVLAAAGREALALSQVGVDTIPGTLFLVGLVVSGVVGYLTIKYFLKYLANHSLTVFAYYRFALAAVTAVWLATL
jgi:undecaprenyl-diphosphatase